VNEVQFTSQVAQWIAHILERYPSLPFSGVAIEEQTTGSQTRRDITLRDKDRRPALTGEVKLPYAADGQSPHNNKLVTDARRKARRAKAPFFFTWNVNDFVLWETSPSEDQPAVSSYRSWNVASINKPGQLEMEATKQAIYEWWRRFLLYFAQVVTGAEALGKKAPDERFIEAIESSLHMPILDTADKLIEAYALPRQKALLDKWMVVDLGWTVSDAPEDIKDTLKRAAQFACYALAIRLVFYEAMLKRHGRAMVRLGVPEDTESGEGLRLHLASLFARAVQATGDYETVFGTDPRAYGDTVPFMADTAVVHWRELIEQIHSFDFTRLDYEVIGNIFERLIAPEERRKYGQFFTRVEVVDLINSFCIRSGCETVLDPACGGGTFLVRAYARKRELNPAADHNQRLAELFGIDVERFAAHLSTVNLATRDLVSGENYPQIARADFFDTAPGKPLLALPEHPPGSGKQASARREVTIPQLDAVVSNPPYIRQESIKRKKDYQALMNRYKVKLSGRSDIHIYFWPHGAGFLKPDGYLAYITSSQWLDVEYGFNLQRWLLDNFRLLALFESIEEPWFVGARVATTVTILQREADASKRAANVVRFIQLRRPLRDVLAHNGSTVEDVRAADTFRDEILRLSENTVNARYRARLISQGNLLKQGIALGQMMRKAGAPPSSEDDEEVPTATAGQYYGGKWGMYLRAPDLWFELLDELGNRLVPLGELAEVRRGITSGKDDFFYPFDCSKDCLDREPDPKEFRQRYGAGRAEVESGKVQLVRCGEGRGVIKPIEARYLELEVHSLMEIDGFVVKPEDCARMILLVPTQPREKIRKYALAYIEWGENQGWHEASTCASRVTEHRDWYDLTVCSRFDVVVPKIQQYRITTILNESRLYQNCALLGFDTATEVEAALFSGVLNSSWCVLSRLQYARVLGNEGNIQLDVYSANMMLVPDPRKATAEQRERVTAAFAKMKGRQAMQFLSERRMRRMSYTQAHKEAELNKLSDLCELDMADRRELDDAVLEMMGVADPARRKEVIGKLYEYLRWFFEQTRQKEELAIVNKKRAKRRGAASPEELARQIYTSLEERYPELLRLYDPGFLGEVEPQVATRELPNGPTSCIAQQVLGGARVVVYRGKRHLVTLDYESMPQAKLAELLIRQGQRGYIRVPSRAEDAARILSDYKQFLDGREEKLRQLIEERTADEEKAERIMAALRTQIGSA